MMHSFYSAVSCHNWLLTLALGGKFLLTESQLIQIMDILMDPKTYIMGERSYIRVGVDFEKHVA